MEIAIGICNCCKSNVYRSAQGGERCGCDNPKRKKEEKIIKTYTLICCECGKSSEEVIKNSGLHKKYCSSCMMEVRRRDAREYQRKKKAQNRLNKKKYGKFKTKIISKRNLG